jgi:DNA-binding CsgD family transcriptional regulator
MPVSRAFNVDRIAADIRELIDHVITGEAGWPDVARSFGERVPGSFVAMIGQSENRPTLNHMSTYNLDPDFGRSFADYYAQINPWDRVWASMKPMDILITEDTAPARQFSNSPFYEDWLKPLGRFDAGAGLQIRHGGSDRIYLSVHYDPDAHDAYGPALNEIYRGIRGHLDRSALLAKKLAGSHETALSQAALSGHGGDCAVVIDQDMRIMDCNASAQTALSVGAVLSSFSGRLRIGRTADTTALRQMVSVLGGGGALDSTRRFIQFEDRSYLARLFVLPPVPMSFASMFAARRLFLVLVRDLTAVNDGLSDKEFSAAFGLTAAEWAMCEILVAGGTIERAAELLGIARDTARQRLKSIFRKTDTNRQAQLVALLIRAHC